MKRTLILAAALFSTVASAATDRLIAGAFTPPRAAPELPLQGSDGKPFSLDRYKGKVVVLEFGFTNCVDVCPVTLAMLAQARDQMGAAGKDMQVVYVTVDPERDTARHLQEVLGLVDPSFIGLTGTPDQIAAVEKAYGVTAQKVVIDAKKNEYAYAHSSFIYFIDPQGMLRALMPFGHPSEDVSHDVGLLLKTGPK